MLSGCTPIGYPRFISTGDHIHIAYCLNKNWQENNSNCVPLPEAPTYFNYREFCTTCDPAEAELELAESQGKAPYEKPRPNKYFNLTGTVCDVSNGTYK